MNLIRYRPMSSIMPWRSAFPFRPSMGSDLGDDTWVPQVDVRETEKEFIVEADLPGFNKEQVKVSIEDDVLTISAEKEHAEEQNSDGYHRVERRHGSFRRSFTMPDIVDSEKIKATSSDGVLTVHLPKVKEKQGSRIRNIKIR